MTLWWHRVWSGDSMKRRALKITAGSLLVAIVAGVAAVQAGNLMTQRAIDDDVEQLLSRNEGVAAGVVTEEDLAGLPDPVQRWLRWSGVVGISYPETVRLRQKGTFRTAPEQDWMPFTAEQYYTINPPGFVWSVSMDMMPLVSISGRDHYIDGEGAIEMRVLSLVPVANKAGGNLNQGAALRYLNEIMWFPTAALSDYITWTEIDASSARATLDYAGQTVSAVFSFDAEGKIVTMSADRYNDEKSAFLPWSTPLIAYGSFDGVRMPVQGTGVWDYGVDGEFEYVRLEITELEFDPA